MSYLEIYKEKVRDLLAEKKPEQKDDEHCNHSSGKQGEWPLSDVRGSSVSFKGTGPVQKDYLRVREHPVTGTQGYHDSSA